MIASRLGSLQSSAALAIGLVLSGVSHSAAPSKPRNWMQGTWSVIMRTDPTRVRIGSAQILDVVNGLIVTYDYDDHKVKAINRSGSLVWETGSAGLQRGQFYNVSDIRHDASSNIWIADPIPRRVTIISPAGTILRSYDNAPNWWRVVPRADSRVWGLDPNKVTPAIYDTSGRVSSRPSFSSRLSGLELPSNNLTLTPGPRDSILVTYLWSDRFVLIGGDGKNPHEYRGIAEQEFPTVVRTPRMIAGQSVTTLQVDSSSHRVTRSASWDGAYIYILQYPKPRDIDTSSTVDIYRSGTGSYVASLALPSRALAISVKSDEFTAIVNDPTPSLCIWRWREGRKAPPN